MTDKNSLRKICRETRKNITDKKDKARRAASIFLKSHAAESADLILLYASFGSEMSTEFLADSLICHGKKIAVPRCSENGVMHFHLIDSRKQLIPGKYGIPEPPENLPIPEITDKTVCIVPGLAFTETGKRLGYGGGYYDRFFAAQPHVYRIGLVYEELILPDIPVMSHDMKMDSLLTEERMVLCSAE